MQANLNECQAHPGEIREMICEQCKKIQCPKCSKASHKTLKGHKPALFNCRLQETYEFLEFLGKGSYGMVISAENTISGQKLAIKFVDEVTDEIALKEAMKEIKVFRNLQHPNIIKYINTDYFKDEDRVVIYMELADKSLQQVIKTLEPTEAMKIFLEICEGVQYLHQQKLIHKDIKPANILIKDGVAKLSDFGLTKKMEGSMVSLSDKANLPGTLNYLSPEIIKGEKYNEKSDVWALGIIFHQLFSKGKNPFSYKQKNEELIKQAILDPNTQLDNNVLSKAGFKKLLEGNFIIFNFVISIKLGRLFESGSWGKIFCGGDYHYFES